MLLITAIVPAIGQIALIQCC